MAKKVNSGEQHQVQAPDNSKAVQKKNVFLNNPIPFLLGGALLIAILWGVLSNQRTAKRFKNEIAVLEQKHARVIDSMQVDAGELFAASLSWAVRSEMLRDNLEQVNGYFTEALKIDAIQSIRLVNHSNGSIILSTNKKEEGRTENNPFILEASKVETEKDENTRIIVAPIFGFNRQFGVLVIEKKH